MKLTIGICAYNEARNIGGLLSNLLDQPLFDHQELLEIIVVSSGCLDGTFDIVRNFQGKDTRIKLVNQTSRQGKSSAQNIILKKAKGDVIVFVSADIYPATGSIAILVDTIKGNIGGADSRVIILNESKGLVNFISRFIWGLHDRTLSHENNRGSLSHIGGDMFAIQRGIISKIPAYVINDDAYMGILIRSQGYRIQFVSQAVYYAFGPSTIRDYISQRRRIIFGHQQLKRLFGQSPMVYRTLTLLRPLDGIYIFFEQIRESRLHDLTKVFPMILLETISSFLAHWDNLQKADRHILWDQIKSTKILVRNEDAVG